MLDLKNQRFERLTVIKSFQKFKNGQKRLVCCCLCSCGNFCEVRADSLKSGYTKSCGCLQRECVTKHGMSKTGTYRTWKEMNQRCENPNNSHFKDYGGRGIKVCDRWKNSFEAFYKDMGDRPEGKTLDRWPNNDGDYELNNCRWATQREQASNTRILCWFRAWHKDSMVQYLSNNQHEFARKHKLNHSNISACLLGKTRQHKGWFFVLQEVSL